MPPVLTTPPRDLSNIPEEAPDFLRSRAAAEMTTIWGSFPNAKTTLRWTYDACSVAFLAFAQRPADFRPCNTAVVDFDTPCGIWAYRPGHLEPVTAHPIRANDYVTDPQGNIRTNREVCEYAWAIGTFMDHDCRIRPLICTKPSWYLNKSIRQQLSRGDDYRTVIGVGSFVYMPVDNKYGMPGGRIYGIVGLDEPPWQNVLFTAPFKYCGAIP